MILAVDLGTSSLKAGLITPEGHLFSRCREPYGSDGISEEFDARLWERAFLRALRRLEPARVSAVALSGNGPTLVAVDSKGEPLAPALLWLQRKSIHIPGTRSYYLPKAAWLREHSGEIWKRISTILSCPEWLQHRLTGRAVMVLPHESFRPYLWDEEQLSAYGLDESLFPEMVPMASVAGRVSAAASAVTGLGEGTPVVAVGSDFMAALLGSGALRPGMVCDRAGTSEGINVCAEVPSEDARLRDLPHAVAPYWNVAVILSSTGSVFEWYRRLTGQEGRDYRITLEEVDAVPSAAPSPRFFFDPRSDRLWEFSGGGFWDLNPRHGRAELGRAVMESIGYAVRQGLEILESVGLTVTEMRVTGGQARGLVWNQMKADITGRVLFVPEIEDAELAGGACCAAAALGRYDSPALAAEALVRIKQGFEPSPEKLRLYDEGYQSYKETLGRLQTLYKK